MQARLFTRPRSCLFFLGTHETSWLARTDVPLFVAHPRLKRRVKLPVARGAWALDSGGFTEITMRGGWTIDARTYGEAVTRYMEHIGNMRWAAIQDWMCEDIALAKTGKTVREHQRLTTRSYLDLNERFPSVPWAPVLQGQEPDDYERHVAEYEAAGVRLADCKIVGVGSVCRRQDTTAATDIFRRLGRYNLKLHGFGLKMGGLERSAGMLASADSLAWSFGARKSPPMAGHRHRSCANCMEYAMEWRKKILAIEGVRGEA